MHGDNDEGMVCSCIINAVKNLNVRGRRDAKQKLWT